MLFMMMRTADERSEAGVPPSAEQAAKVNRLIHEMLGAGVLVVADGLLPSSSGARVTFADGKRVVADGPFKEQNFDAFAVLRLDSRDEAIEWGGRLAAAHAAGFVEIRQVSEMSNFGSLASRPTLEAPRRPTLEAPRDERPAS